MLLLVGFGWAKPVPVNPLYFSGSRRWGMLKVALAGPVMNFIIAFVAGIGLQIYLILVPGPFLEVLNMPMGIFLQLLLGININLMVFNLIPVPPLDGSKILFSLLPPRYSRIRFQMEQYGFLILLVLLLTNIYRFFLEPLSNILQSLIVNLSYFLVSPFF